MDQIVCSTLINRGYPVHYYFQFMKLASDCLRELNFSTLKLVKTKKLNVNSYGAVDLPPDYVDYVKVGIGVGQYVKPIGTRDSINRLNNFNANAQKVKYDEIESSSSGWVGYWYHNTINENGENIGRQYGEGGVDRVDSFKVLPERWQIQFDEHLNIDFVVLEYISDGMESDNATKLHPYAQSTIEAYIIWKMKDASRTYGEGERREAERKYFNELRMLRARMADWTIPDILRAVRSQYAIKS